MKSEENLVPSLFSKDKLLLLLLLLFYFPYSLKSIKRKPIHNEHTK